MQLNKILFRIEKYKVASKSLIKINDMKSYGKVSK